MGWAGQHADAAEGGKKMKIDICLFLCFLIRFSKKNTGV
jgi:hypothetical protein